MMTTEALALLLSCLTPPSSAAAPAPRAVTVVVGRADAPLLRKLTAAARGRAALSVHSLKPNESADPIEKGRLLASLASMDLIVAVGDEATAFVTRELEDAPVYFVGAGLVPGERLSSPSVSGLFSYSVESLLDAVEAMLPGTLGLAYTPGYEPVAAWIRKGAAERGLPLSERRIASLKELAPAVRDLLETSRAIWVVGDPMLVRGAGFEFLRERSLSRGVPMIANGPWEVRQGALLAFEPEAVGLSSRAAEMLGSILDGELAPEERLQSAPREGALLLNGALVDKWNISPPAGRPWRLLR
ncbi:MAG: hypothetical protein HYV14_00415 [Elusimicrobia bacterium]|nr:hypothetical protein [Elusimicrobiota bacterium]